jgi:hypothetical protein
MDVDVPLGSMDVDVPLGSMDVDVTNIHGYPSSAFTAGRLPGEQLVCIVYEDHDRTP